MRNSYRTWRVLIAFFCFLILLTIRFAHSSSAQNDCAAEGADLSTPVNSIGKQLQPILADYFLDPAGAIEPADVASQSFAKGGCEQSFEIASPNGALWLRFRVVNRGTSKASFAAGFMETIFDDVRLFEAGGGTLILLSRNGRAVPLQERARTAIKMAMPFEIGHGEEKTFYMRVSGTFAPHITPVIAPLDLFVDWSTMFGAIMAVMLGFTAALLLFGIICFRHMEIRFYQYYALYILCLFLFPFFYDGWFSLLTGSTLPVSVMVRIMELVAGIGIFANIQYCRILLMSGTGGGAYRWTFISLSAVTLFATTLAVIDPWAQGIVLHIVYVASPLILLFICAKKIREGLRHAKAVCASLLSLAVGLFIANYFFLFPVEIIATDSVFQLMLMRPVDWGFNCAVIGEAIFMTIAISMLLSATQGRAHSAIAEVEALQRAVKAVETQRAEAQKLSGARIEALQTILVEASEKNSHAPIEQRFLERAAECVRKHASKEDFGAKELATALGTSEKTLGRRLKSANGLTPAMFIRSIRLSLARDLILLRQLSTVAEAAHAAGFASVSHFSKLYREEFKESPSESLRSIRRAGAG